MRQATKDAIKLALRRFALRLARKFVDAIDDRLHAAEVRLRNDIAGKCGIPSVERVATPHRPQLPATHESFAQWEARRSGLAPKRTPRRRGVTSAEFNRRLADEMEAVFAEGV